MDSIVTKSGHTLTPLGEVIDGDTCTLGICSLCSGPSGEPKYTMCIPCSLEFMDEDPDETLLWWDDASYIRYQTGADTAARNAEYEFQDWLNASPLNRLEYLKDQNQTHYGLAVSQLWCHVIDAHTKIDAALGYDEPPCPF